MASVRRVAVAALFGVGFLAAVAMQGLVAGDRAVRSTQEPIQVTVVGDSPADNIMADRGGTARGMMGLAAGMAVGNGVWPEMGRGDGFGARVVPNQDLSADDVRHFLEIRLEWQANKLPYPQMARALALAIPKINQWAAGGRYFDGAAWTVGDMRNVLGQAVRASKRGGSSDASDSPPVSFPGPHYCGTNLAQCAAMTPGPQQLYGGAGHRSFGGPPLQGFSDFRPALIPHPPKTVS